MPSPFHSTASEFPCVGGESHIASRKPRDINKRDGDGLWVTAILRCTVRTRAPGLPL